MSIYDYASSSDMLTAADIAAALNNDHQLHEALRGPGVSLTDGAFDPNVEPAFHRPEQAAPLVTSKDVRRLAKAEDVTTETVGNALLPRATLYSLREVREALGLPAVADTGARKPKPAEPENKRPSDIETAGFAAQHTGTDKETVLALVKSGAVTNYATQMEMRDQDGNVSTVLGKPMVSRSEVAAVLTNTLGL